MPAESAITRPRDRSEQTRGDNTAVAELAERQHGVVGRRQLLALGLGEDAIDGRLHRGILHRLRSGAYAVGHRAITQEGRWMAAVLGSGDGAVLSHHAAAALWEIRGVRGGPIDVTVPRKSRSNRGIRRHCSRLPTDEVMIHRGIPVTTVPRTLFDLAAVAPAIAVESALRESEHLRLHDRLSLPDFLARYPGHRGARAIRACLARRAEHSGRIRSPLEERFLPFLRRHRLPMPQLDAWIEIGERRYQVDCLWPQAMLVVELDDYESHGTSVASAKTGRVTGACASPGTR